ncbi:DNA-3-methyladenine glycosylase family protein [Pseudoroseicyclus tamaricis]|uniref:DNA-3-methyladenine glycosylase II n=1 Tax=Pseudoroseicyclus tamaricis TaxID=2705421 RepID=A0A6B2JZK4_9RHOB|nr:DNA-3-methyladenine glycosylase 2 family protein [Pseudoroseicyclus tamaricis]NDV00802.1 DNA-3-methyladenine glycosylase 2 family protein [Pseudoroseicyclus tamaricis]
MSRIDSEDDLRAGIAALSAREPRFAAVHALTGDPPLRRRPRGFATLLHIINGQMISTAAADAIWSRIKAAGLHDPTAIAAAEEALLLSHGFSRAKARSARAIAAAAPDFEAMARLPDDELLRALTALPGVGPWTAELYALTAEGRADVLPAGDLAMQEAARLLFDLPSRPDAKALRHLAESWSPWRAVAARLLWSYYLHHKGRAGIS